MIQVKYIGRDSSHTLSASDLKKVDVEGFHKTTFERNVPVEVEDNVAEALTENSLFGGNWALHLEDDDESPEEDDADEKDAKPKKAKSEKLDNSSGTGSANSSSSASITGTGNGASTSGSASS